jgi:hypothetical protein
MYRLEFLIDFGDDEYSYKEEMCLKNISIESSFVPQIGMTLSIPISMFEILESAIKKDVYLSEKINLDNFFKVKDVYYSFNNSQINLFSITLSFLD